MSKESDPDSGLKGSKLETKSYGGNDRLQRILSVVRERGIITPKELRILFPEVSTRTLRRDMDVLAKAKLVSQKGSTKSTFYKYTGK
jgi:predicted HTH transcriptional regulator